MQTQSNENPTEFEKRCCEINCADETLLLHADRAVYWPAQHTLLVADVHLGKEYVFSRAGNAIPEGPSEADIHRLAQLVHACGANRLIVLGDLIHAQPSPTEHWLITLGEFLDQHQQLSVEVVAGNHDKPAGRDLLDTRIIWHTESLVEAAFVLQHKPAEDQRGHVLCGHIHPCFRLSAGRNDSVRAPVFWFGAKCSVLPAFGQFTGGHNVRPAKSDRLYMIGPECVLPVYGNTETTELA